MPDDTTDEVEGVWILNPDGMPEVATAPFNKYSSIREDLKFQGYSPASNFSRQMHERKG